ncbi:MAG: DNA polymerase III subunit alpha [Lachnospiraceae bacterium]|nr:DNA polymerase III subunit alpha [Lachnospiraceae bacterium]
MAFVHLHTHTEYSLLDGSNKIKEYVARVKDLGMNAAAITDHGVMYGVIDFYKECMAQGIRPVIGCEVYVAPGSRFDKEVTHGDDRYHHLILLAENNTGYQNLMKIVSIGFVDGYYYKPRVDKETLRRYHEGLICTSACLAGEVASNLKRGLKDQAEKAALEYLDIFGKGNFYLELQDHMDGAQTLVNQDLIRLSKKLDIPLVATNDCHYTYPDDVKPHDILLCLQTGKKLNDEDRMRYEGGQYYVKSEEEMLELFSFIPEALENTQKIADRCNIEIVFHETKLPHFEIPAPFNDSLEYLKHLAYTGLKERYPEDDGTLKARLDYELSVIVKMGYVDYFLIVWDYINYARSNGIPVGPGRGSAAGAVLSYCLKITDIDPIRYSLLFERFLNPERVSMPDIDVDFAYEGRQQVIDYVVEKYGRSKCVQIVTFGTLQAKGVLRDVCRVMDLPYARGDQLARLVPAELGMTLSKALEINKDFKELYDTDPEVREVVDMSLRLEGLPRHTSMHAAGILITPEDADNYVPLSRQGGGEITTQFTMTTLEELGLLKMDFLGLRTLTVIKDAVDAAVERHPGLELDIDKIDMDDPAVLEYIGTGATEGIFQIESGGMQVFMKRLKPKSLEDIIAGIALYRPGPMDFIPKYIAGKNDPAHIDYDAVGLVPILNSTYGCIVYQEQVMQIFQNLAGYSLGQADNIRRAMSKKKQYVIDENRKTFIYGDPDQDIKGCVDLGVPETAANKIYDSMNDFAKYAFNKSHAACYAVITMQTAYLKYYYPVEFMAALLTSFIDNPRKVSEYILVCRSMDIKILAPDINEGFGNFTATGERSIRYGMSAIKSLGWPSIEAILRERNSNGPFTDIRDFANRLSGREVNKRAVENLIKAGALDSLPGNRKQKLIVAPDMMDEAAAEKKNGIAGQISLFDLMADKGIENPTVTNLPETDEYPAEVLLSFEKEVLGIYISGHPLDAYTDLWKKHSTATSNDFILGEDGTPPSVSEGSEQTIGGMISDIVIRRTKKGDALAILSIEDLVGNVQVFVWPNEYRKYKDLIQMDQKVFITGRVRYEDERDAGLSTSSLTLFDEMPVRLYIRFDNKAAYEDNNKALMSILNQADEGGDTVIVYLKETKQQKKLSVKVTASEVLPALKQAFGDENAVIV